MVGDSGSNGQKQEDVMYTSKHTLTYTITITQPSPTYY